MRTQDTRENRTTQSSTDIRQGRDPGRSLARRQDVFGRSIFDPFDLMRSFFSTPLGSPWSYSSGRSEGEWAPQLETFQRGDEFVVRADLPGLQLKDISVELKDDALVIEGERSNESEKREEGYYSTERSYGRFCRIVSLPEGAIGDSAKATFKNGVLEVVLQAPPHEATRGRRIEISGEAQKR
jgi:HSP20 family protein